MQDVSFPVVSREGTRNRLRLILDLAVRGERLLRHDRTDGDAIQGAVLLDQSLEQCLKVAADLTGRSRKGDRFWDLVLLFNELDRGRLQQLRDLRNLAQHQGIPPPSETREASRSDWLHSLRTLFLICGENFDCFSSVGDVRSPWLAAPLGRALGCLPDLPNDAAAHAALAYERLFGLAQEVVGWASIPEEMWVFGGVPRWRDLKSELDCADGRNESMTIGTSIGGAHVLGLSAAQHVRFRRLVRGHCIDVWGDPPRVVHEKDARDVTAEQARWLVELIARASIHIEEEWPEAVASMNEDIEQFTSRFGDTA